VIVDGIGVHHAGDAGLFERMKLIGEPNRPDVALNPIGNRHTMGPREAAIAVSCIRPDLAIPMHHDTTPVFEQDSRIRPISKH
jgi:L-ascorbate metabolism protein UlaG (beta-lactamase superfamily)